MLEMKIDLTGLAGVINEANPDLSVLQRGVVEAAQYVRDVWRSAVNGTILPGMTRAVNDDKYDKALSTGESMQFPRILHAIVLPVNYVDGAQTIETGTPAHDMKPALLNGPKARPTADGLGKYNIIPFRHYTPSANSAIAIKMRMPDEVFQQAKQLERSIPNPDSGSMAWGQSLDWDKGVITRKSPDLSQWNDYTHQNNIYDGMYRVGYERHSQYLTFRMVSTPRTKIITRGPNKGKTVRLGSSPDSWINPGTPGNPLVQAVFNRCMPEIDKNLKALAMQVFGIN